MNNGSFLELTITCTTHIVIALLGSVGFRYKYQAFLRHRNIERIRQQYKLSTWSHTWRLTYEQAEQAIPRNNLNTIYFLFFSVYFLTVFYALMLLVVSLFTDRSFDTGSFGYFIAFLILLALSYYVSFTILPEYEGTRRLAKTTEGFETRGQKANMVMATICTVLCTLLQFLFSLLYALAFILEPIAEKIGSQKDVSFEAPMLLDKWPQIITMIVLLMLTGFYAWLYFYTWLKFLPRFNFEKRYNPLISIWAVFLGRLLLEFILRDRARHLRLLKIGQLPSKNSRHVLAKQVVYGSNNKH